MVILLKLIPMAGAYMAKFGIMHESIHWGSGDIFHRGQGKAIIS